MQEEAGLENRQRGDIFVLKHMEVHTSEDGGKREKCLVIEATA